MEAKGISKVFKFVAPLFVMVSMYLKWTGVVDGVDVEEVIKAGCFVYASGAGTIDLNLIVDKLVGLKKGKEEQCAGSMDKKEHAAL